MTWRTMDDAPKDGTQVLLFRPATDLFDAVVAQGWFEDGAFDRRWYDAYSEEPCEPQPSHWMPLPPPPEQASEARG